MNNLKDGDIVQQFDGHGHPIYKEGRPVLRKCVSNEKYKKNLDVYGNLEYVTIEICVNNPKRFKKLETGFRPYRISDEMNKKELIVQEITKDLAWNPNLLEQIAAVENTDNKYLSERERGIVLSVLQWMGTHVGSFFIEKVNLIEKDIKDKDVFSESLK
jgi:hypothetical protein